MKNFDIEKTITECNDVDFITKMLTEYLPMDYENIEKGTNDIMATMMKISVDEYRNNRLKECDYLKGLYEKRANELGLKF